jgi:transposase
MDAHSLDVTDEATDARKTNHTSARMGRVEVLAHADRRRFWTIEQKRKIVAESLGSELTPTEVARKHRISTGQLYTWRQQLLDVRGSGISPMPLRFAPVELVSPELSRPDPLPLEILDTAPAASSRAEGLIEIQLPGGVSLRVDAHVDGHALRRILDALDGR